MHRILSAYCIVAEALNATRSTVVVARAGRELPLLQLFIHLVYFVLADEAALASRLRAVRRVSQLLDRLYNGRVQDRHRSNLRLHCHILFIV